MYEILTYIKINKYLFIFYNIYLVFRRSFVLENFSELIRVVLILNFF